MKKTVKFYLPNIIFTFLFSCCFSFMAYYTVLIENAVIRFCVYGLLISFILFCFAVMTIKLGIDSMNNMISNDILRERMIRTGEMVEIHRGTEYAWWKGLIIGAFAGVPTVVLIIVHFILTSINPSLSGAGLIAGIINLPFILPFKEILNLENFTNALYYFCLISLPLNSLATMTGYVIGAKKISLSRNKIKEINKKIYGK